MKRILAPHLAIVSLESHRNLSIGIVRQVRTIHVKTGVNATLKAVGIKLGLSKARSPYITRSLDLTNGAGSYVFRDSNYTTVVACLSW